MFGNGKRRLTLTERVTKNEAEIAELKSLVVEAGARYRDAAGLRAELHGVRDDLNKVEAAFTKLHERVGDDPPPALEPEVVAERVADILDTRPFDGDNTAPAQEPGQAE